MARRTKRDVVSAWLDFSRHLANNPIKYFYEWRSENFMLLATFVTMQTNVIYSSD